MESEMIVIHAENAPMPGISKPGPHQRYRHPVISVEKRRLGALHADEIRVQMIYAGLCGTDVHLMESDPQTGYIRSSAPANIPETGRVIGHEGIGKVLAVGKNVRHLSEGAVVTFESIIVCHYCDVCRKGQFNQCRNAKLLGLEKDGIFGKVVDVPAMLAHDVTPIIQTDQDLQAIACVEPAGVAYVACRNTRVTGGDVVVIFGGGPIGVFAAMLCKTIFGASSVSIVEPVSFRRSFAAQWADHVYDVEAFFANMPECIDVVIEASGDLQNINRIFRNVNANGRIALLARSGTSLVLDAMDHMITNAISIIGSRGHLCGAFNDIISLYKQGRLPLHQVVTHILDGTDGFMRLVGAIDSVLYENCKVLIRFASANGRS
ncbi:zinc-dependent alcohol dehydrogenase [Desulfatirhabdium butyrativorans]|uniref:zinc-dependent alcohol dehydrogenase n=1 Tax=Desulfatirhabdium butyrativorans TaxID=340467 RepID=UPI0003F5F756|nr:alcohol dehydrogenase catalytic domain-containing protein [Desulfatirhabdium butyrativorans]